MTLIRIGTCAEHARNRRQYKYNHEVKARQKHENHAEVMYKNEKKQNRKETQGRSMQNMRKKKVNESMQEAMREGNSKHEVKACRRHA